MSILGAYPLTVFVGNIFNPASDTVVYVKHYHHPTYYDDNTKSYRVDSIPPGDQLISYSVYPGQAIGFPMYLADEALEISLANPYTDSYSVQVGARAGCTLEDSNGESIAPTIPTSFGVTTDESGSILYYKGGTWNFSSSTELWTLNIRKFTFDPESENVVIGPGTPG